MPGVSIAIIHCCLASPKKLVTTQSTSVVSEAIAFEVIKSFSPHTEFAKDDFPCPVTPMKHKILKLLAKL